MLGRAAGCTLLALAQAPGKWGAEGHSCPPKIFLAPPSSFTPLPPWQFSSLMAEISLLVSLLPHALLLNIFFRHS